MVNGDTVTMATWRYGAAVLSACAIGISSLASAPPASAERSEPTPIPLAPAASPQDRSMPDPSMTDRLIVGLVSSRTSDATVEAVTEQAGNELGVPVAADVTSAITPTTAVVSLGEPLPLEEVEALAAEVASSVAITYAQPDRILTPSVELPNDPDVSQQWGLWDGSRTAGGFSARAPEGWPNSRGDGIVVAVIDTGITSHPDLNDHLVAGYDFVDEVRVANDGDRRDADPSDPGDWISPTDKQSPFFSNCRITNSSWHGTHVAGTIAAVTNNALGVAGVAPGARVQPLRALGKCGGYTSDVAAAIRWASGASVSGVPANPTPAKVINLSLGGWGACVDDPATQSAITTAVSQGSTVVVAAGNDDTSAALQTPASCTGVITVAAHGQDGSRASFSNYGADVEITGPGVGILSTLNTGTTVPGSPTYGFYSGTSMATPHVAAAAAILMAADPALTPADVLAKLQSNARPLTSGTCSSPKTCGSGYVDTTAALNTIAPGAPTAVSATAGRGRLAVTWAAPVGLIPSQYAVEYSDDSVTWTAAPSTSATSTLVTGLSDDSTYWMRVRASAPGGTSAWTESAGAQPLPLTTPSTPISLTVTPGDGSLALTWAPPTDDGGLPVTSYTVEHSSDNANWVTVSPVVGTSTTITGLANGQAYAIRVAATNSLGTGPWTSSTGTPAAPPPSGGGGGGGGNGGSAGGGGGGGAAPPPPPPPAITAPGAPVINAVTPGDRTISATWRASDDTGGEAPTSFAVELEGNETTVSREVSTTDTSFVDLVNGVPYRLRVAAINSGGTGPWSEWSAVVTPRGLATAPLGLTARAADSAVTLTWMPPESNGGSEVSGYVVEVSALGIVQQLSVTDTSTVLAGLVNGRAYATRVAAVTAAGQGAWSAPVTVTPRAVRVGPPRDIQAKRSSRKVTVTWAAPAVGTPLRYVVFASIDGKPSRMVDTTRATRSTFSVTARTRTVLVRIAAVDVFGRGPFSQPATARSGR